MKDNIYARMTKKSWERDWLSTVCFTVFAAISYLLSEELGLNPGDTFEVKKAGKYEKCRVASYCKRILYMLDGKIWGELSLEGQTNQTQEQREEKVRQWLEKMGW